MSTASHFFIHSTPSSPQYLSVAGVTPHHQTYPANTKYLESSKAVTRVVCVTKPYRKTPLHPHQGGVDAPWAPKPRYNFSIYCANPFLLFLRPLLLSPASHNPALGPSEPFLARPALAKTPGANEQPGAVSKSALTAPNQPL